MANEAVIVELMGDPKGVPVSYTCANGVGIEKGALLWFSDNRTVSGSSTIDKPFAGIAAHEKVANDGSTHIGCWTKGIFDLTCTANVFPTAGNYVKISGQNLIAPCIANFANDMSGGYIIGKALETGSASEVIQVAVGIY